MGTDIHIYTEILINENGTEIWKDADSYVTNYIKNKPVRIEIYNDRNYDLFGLLAGVRSINATPFKLSNTRLPEGCNKSILDEYAYWGKDAHDISFYTLHELREYVNKIEDYLNCYSEDDISYLRSRIYNICSNMSDRYHAIYGYNSFDYTKIRIVFWFDS